MGQYDGPDGLKIYWCERLERLAAEQHKLRMKIDRALVDAMADGVSIRALAEASGISKSTLHRRFY
ncbi:MAG: helix-turn-helix transcriptional regulator [Gemmatimonadetes bacterium]|nr:helix-turn-helix transcriptional regulator [Gemmatimonadota bacterium]MYF08810.1 helix-turn-helix transcriptional regulator [Rhodospirillaceae bacterium]